MTERERPPHNTGPPSGHVTAGAQFVCFLNNQFASLCHSSFAGCCHYYVAAITTSSVRCGVCVTKHCPHFLFFFFFSSFTLRSYYSRVASIIGAGGLLFRADADKEVALPLLQLLTASCVTGNCHVLERVLWVLCLHTIIIISDFSFQPSFLSSLPTIGRWFSRLYKNKCEYGEFVFKGSILHCYPGIYFSSQNL